MSYSSKNPESGNVILYVLIGIFLVGLLTAAIRNVGGGNDNIDKENLLLKAGQAQRHAAEIARGVNIILEKKVSEADLRFAHDDAPSDYGLITTTPEYQIFSTDGGSATYRMPPAGVNDGSSWEVFATSAIPQVGSDKADLIAVLPHVTEAFCNVINAQLGFDTGTMPTDDAAGSPSCVMGDAADRFDGTFNDSSPNPLDDTSFSKLPAYQACVSCASNDTYNYYYVLMAR